MFWYWKWKFVIQILEEVIEFLDSFWIQKDERKDAMAHYKCFRAVQYNHLVYMATGNIKTNLVSKMHKLFEEASNIAEEHFRGMDNSEMACTTQAVPIWHLSVFMNHCWTELLSKWMGDIADSKREIEEINRTI